ncbi:uncharacterized protein LOC144915181 [Branchiostoma floridae x Branchiostoma belcheri]
MAETPTTPKLETVATTKMTTLSPTDTTTSTTPMWVETSVTTATVTTAPDHTATWEASTSKRADPPLPVKTTKPYSIKTTESYHPKYTTAAKDGDQAAQSGDSGTGGGNTAVFAAAGAAGGVAVLVGVGVTVFICRRRNLRNSEACNVPMQRLDASNNHNTDYPGADVENVEVENPLYGAMDEFNALGIAVTDSTA